MCRYTNNAGITTIELIICVTVAAMLSAAIFSVLTVIRSNSTITETHREASVYLTALQEYYWRYCEVSPFPQPSYFILKDNNILVHEVAANPISNSDFVPSIEWVGTTRATAVLSLQFADADSAFRVAAASRKAEQQGNTVVWRQSLSRLNSAHSGFKSHVETEIFAPNKCQA